MKYAYAILLSVMSFVGVAFTQAKPELPIQLPEEELQSLIDEALSQNPDIAAEYYKMEAAVQRIPQTGALDDPELVFKLMEIPGTRLNEAMYANVELMQMIPFPTKLSARRSIANLLSEHAHHDHMEKVVQIVSELKTALAMLSYAREASTITAENQQVLMKILNVSETAYTVGKSTQQEVLRTKIELAKLTTDQAGNLEQIATAENMVRRLLNRSGNVLVGRFDLGTIGPLPPVSILISYAERNRPMLIHDSLNVVEKEMNVRLMKQEYIPDLKLSLEYVRLPMTMENKWSISAGITLPFSPWTLSKASSRVQEAEAEQHMLASMYISSKNMSQTEIRNKCAVITSLTTQIHQLKDSVIPMLTQSIELLLTDYSTGRTSYPMVLDGYRMYNDMRRELAMTTMKYHQTISSLEREIGVTDIRSVVGMGKGE
jgi:outer membrane protein, heavy metal efflux system